MFNEKVMCLFKKDTAQLVKEANRRGITQYKGAKKVFKSNEELIAKIIYKDAYDAGKNDAIRNCPANYCGIAKPEVHEYCFYDINRATKYRLELTEEQVSAIEWMIDHDFITDAELSEWEDSFEDVGRI